ncbi:MAG: M16 family metallopeptidase [Myxococcota bacterium]
MKRLVVAAALFFGCATPLRVSEGRVLPPELQFDPTRLSVGAPATVPAPAVEHLALPNGLRVSFVEARGAGLVDVSLLVRCGRVDDAPGVPGASEAMLSLAFSGGAGDLDARALRAGFRALGSVPALSVDDGEMWAASLVLSEHLERYLELVALVLRAPRFEADAVRDELERRSRAVELPATRASSLAFVARQRAIYAGSPQLAQSVSSGALAKLSREQLVERASRCLGASNVALAVSGDLSRAQLEAALAPLAAVPTGASVTHPPAPFVARARSVTLQPTDADQVDVTLVGPGLPPGGDRSAANLLAELVRSSLQWELRDAGKVYSVRVMVDVGPGDGATWVRFTTRREVAFEATRRALSMFERWWQRWPLTTELIDKVKKRQSRNLEPPERRAFAHARARLQDLAIFDGVAWDAGPLEVKEHQLRAFFVRAFKPVQLQLVVTGPFDPASPWQTLAAPK